MRPAAFDYVAPASVEAALDALEAGGYDAKPLAGGQSLVPMMSFRLARPELLVDLRHLSGLHGISVSGDRAVIGAMTTHREIESSEELFVPLPLMRVAAREIGHPAIRNRGTIGGSLVHADAAAEWPVVAAALDARIRAVSKRGERTIPAREFFLGYFTTALEHDELLTAVELPLPGPRAGWSFQEFARQPGAFALVIAIATAELDASGRIGSLTVALGGVDAAPVLADTAALIGAAPTRALIAEAAQALTDGLRPPGDLHATAQDRREIARALVRRTLAEALTRAGAPDVDTEGRG